MKQFNKLSETELKELSRQVNLPMTEEYKESFWQKTYINENLLNDNRYKNWKDDFEFCKQHGITFKR